MARKRSEKCSNDQRMYLIDFMVSHSAFATNKLIGVQGREGHAALWERLTRELNTKGTAKTVEKWQKVTSSHPPTFQ